jgi:hypothetical protein
MIVPSLRRWFASAAVPPPDPHSDMVERLVHLAQRGKVTLYPHGPAMLIAVPDADVHDWYVLGACQHLSGGDISRAKAEQWKCPVCDEQRANGRNINDLAERLRLLSLRVSADTERN